jgi:uncharacterized protein (DUF305 family)
MKKISLYLTISFAIVAAIIGMGIGYFLTPEYRTAMYEKNTMDLGSADRTYDLRYINAMIVHHRGAMLLAEQLQQSTTRPEMNALATEILTNEPKAIDELYAWKKEWYNDSRTVRDPIVANLGTAGDTFDLRFLNAIIAHHEAGLLMTKDASMKSSRAEILDNANAVSAFLTNGLQVLKGLRQTWYNV